MINHPNPERSPDVLITTAKRDGTCENCGQSILQGERYKWSKSRLKGFHLTCAIVKERTDIADVAVKRIEVPSYLVGQVSQLHDGRFTIPFQLSDGKKRHITLWITTRKKKYAGQRRIRVFHGRDNTRDYVDAAYIDLNGTLHFLNSFFRDPSVSKAKLMVAEQAITMLAKSTEEELVQFGMQYALLSRRCWRCHRVLTNPETLKLQSGCGPVCDKFYTQNNIDPSKIVLPTVTSFVMKALH